MGIKRSVKNKLIFQLSTQDQRSVLRLELLASSIILSISQLHRSRLLTGSVGGCGHS